MLLPLFVLLLLWAVEHLESCTCPPRHPQEIFCTADYVLQALVTGKKEVELISNGSPFKRVKYDIQQVKRHKGSPMTLSAVYTATSSVGCGVSMEPDSKTIYLISGKIHETKLYITSCDLVLPWNKLTNRQQSNLANRYEMGCRCKISYCWDFPCLLRNPEECLWTDFVVDETLKGDQFKHYACLKSIRNVCSWDKGGY